MHSSVCNFLYCPSLPVRPSARQPTRQAHKRVRIHTPFPLYTNAPLQSLGDVARYSTQNGPSGVARSELFYAHSGKNLITKTHLYSNILKILQPKKENFRIKKSDIFHIPAKNIDCGYSLEPPQRGGSNEYPQYIFFIKIRKIMYTPVNPSFTI